jgi:hypothetical protein
LLQPAWQDIRLWNQVPAQPFPDGMADRRACGVIDLVLFVEAVSHVLFRLVLVTY